MNTCQTCKAFNAMLSQCRANPPIPILIQSPMGTPSVGGMFPAVSKEDWCLKHIRIEDELKDN